MGVSVIGMSGPEMTELNDLGEDEGKSKTKTKTKPLKTTLIIAMRRYMLPTSMGFINIYFLRSDSNSEILQATPSKSSGRIMPYYDYSGHM